jgi:lipopolysaccharide/colanic/teichoic acid biosynthesis glycosyltransferase
MNGYALLKRIIDVVLALALAVLFLPVWIIVPFIIKFYSKGGSIFYVHKRMGKDGKQFWLYKFRTMVENADEILYKKNKKLLKKFKEGDWKLKNDPRITKWGRVIRNLTIDEFPQLYNVLKGEMSIIGPRAYLAQEIKEQTKKYPETKKMIKEVLKVKPGITGPWQTSGRNEVPFKKRVEMDYEYARNHSWLRDLSILLKTPAAMISKW